MDYHRKGLKLYVPASQWLMILGNCHDSKMAGHFGFMKMLQLVKRQFWWPSLKKDIESYVANCSVWASAKRRQGKTPGFLQMVVKLSASWREIFIVEFPESTGNMIIWVVIDLFSKQVHFIPCHKIPLSQGLAKLFLHHIYQLHGATQCIISDRGVQFTFTFWRAFLDLLDTYQGLIFSHHPQMKGVCEHTNSVLEQYLRWFINYQ